MVSSFAEEQCRMLFEHKTRLKSVAEGLEGRQVGGPLMRERVTGGASDFGAGFATMKQQGSW